MLQHTEYSVNVVAQIRNHKCWNRSYKCLFFLKHRLWIMWHPGESHQQFTEDWRERNYCSQQQCRVGDIKTFTHMCGDSSFLQILESFFDTKPTGCECGVENAVLFLPRWEQYKISWFVASQLLACTFQRPQYDAWWRAGPLKENLENGTLPPG